MKVSEQVMAVLSVCRTEGNALFITGGQLDRKLYEATNKVLEVAGGKWNRKTKAHLFPIDAADAMDSVLLTGEVTVAKDEFNYFPSPAAVVERLMELADICPGMDALEPSASQGAIAVALCAAGGNVHAFEILDSNIEKLVPALRKAPGSNRVVQADFLKEEPSPIFDRIVMNPPFAKQADIKHVTHAIGFLKPGGRLVAVMSAGIKFREDRTARTFRALLEQYEGEIEALAPGSFKESGTSVNTVIVSFSHPGGTAA
jgi:protein-L-isoaspartate O-methyltransferase